MRRSLLALSLMAGALSCGDGLGPRDFLDTPPAFVDGDAAGLQFTASIRQSSLRVGDTASVVFLLKNPTSNRVRLHFGGCQILPTVRRGNEDVVSPAQFACIGAMTQLVLEPGAERRTAFAFRANGVGPEPHVSFGFTLTPGDYVAFAELMNGEGRSTAVRFSIEGE